MMKFEKYEIEILKLNIFLTFLACGVTALFLDIFVVLIMLTLLISFNIFLIVFMHWYFYERKK